MALDPTAQKALYAGGNATVSMPNCNLVSNSSASNAIDVSGSPSVTVNGACGDGGISANADLVDNWNATGSGCFLPDPYTPFRALELRPDRDHRLHQSDE